MARMSHMDLQISPTPLKISKNTRIVYYWENWPSNYIKGQLKSIIN